MSRQKIAWWILVGFLALTFVVGCSKKTPPYVQQRVDDLVAELERNPNPDIIVELEEIRAQNMEYPIADWIEIGMPTYKKKVLDEQKRVDAMFAAVEKALADNDLDGALARLQPLKELDRGAAFRERRDDLMTKVGQASGDFAKARMDKIYSDEHKAKVAAFWNKVNNNQLCCCAFRGEKDEVKEVKWFDRQACTPWLKPDEEPQSVCTNKSACKDAPLLLD